MSRRLRRGLTAAAVLLVVLVVGGYLAVRLALNSGYARGLVAEKLTAALGVPVEVDSLSVGRSASSVGFRVGEFLVVKSAAVDVPLASLARGDVGAGAVTLSGVTVNLHVDAHGKVLTPLPKGGGSSGAPQVPVVHLADATLTIAQDGRPPFTLRNLSGDLTPADGKLTVAARSDDPEWGGWRVAGTIDLATKSVRVELINPAAPLRLDLLKSVPWVPAETWEQVHPSGSSPAAVTLDFQGPTDVFTYGVVLTPRGAGLELPELGVSLAEVAGTVRVGGQVVTLEGLSGKLAAGTLNLDGKLDFGPEPSVLGFKAQAQGVDVTKLPPGWNLPKQIGGKLRGTADLTVLVYAGGRVETRGEGRGELEGGTVAGFPAEVRLRLRGDGKRFRFEDGDTTPKAAAPPRWFAPLLLLQPPAAAAPASSFGAAITLRDVDLAQLLQKLEVKLDYKLSGKVTVVARVAVPVSADAAEKTTTVRGSVTSKRLGFEGLAADDVSAELVYTNGVLTLSSLKAAFDEGGVVGRLAGSATAAVNPRGEVTAKLTLESVPLGQVLRAIPGGPFPVAGPVSGRAEFRAPLDKLTDTATWQATGELTSPALVAAGRTVSGVRLPLRVAGGKASLVAAVASVEGIPLTADAAVTLTGQFPYAAEVRSDPQQVATLTKLVPELTLPVPIDGKLAATAKAVGTLSPATVKADGTLTASALKVGPGTADHVSAKWALTPDRVTIRDLDADVFKGKVTGSADVPLSETEAGRFEVAFTDLDAAGAASLVPNAPVKLTGRVSGKVAGAIPAGTPRTTTAELDLTAPRLTVQGVPAEKLVGTLKVLKGGLDYKLTGKTLGGDFELEGRYPGDGAKPGEAGKLSLRRADLGRLGQFLPSVAALGGEVSLDLTYAPDLTSGSGKLTVSELSWGDEEIAPEVRGRLAVRAGQLHLDDLSGKVADGQLSGRGRVRLDRPADNFFRFRLDAADGRRLLAPFAGDVFDGQAGAEVKLWLFPRVRATAEVVVSRGKLAGLDVSGLRLPVEYDAGRVSIRGATTTVGEGRADIDLSYEVDARRLAGQVRFRDLRVSRLGGPESVFGGGRVTGRFDLGGENVRSANDLTGRLVGTVRQANVREIPVLNVVAPFLNPTALARPFDRGDIQGRLRGGVFRLERLTLANDQADLFADGTITLQRRLDLRVVARTGNLSGSVGILRAFGARIPALGPIPVGLILDVSEFLSNRTVRLDVTGTTSQPVVRVNTSALLAEEAVRFLLSRYLPGLEQARELTNGRP